MGKKADFIRKNALTGLALTISALTLFIYVRQTNILVQQTKANSWPHLVFGRNYFGGEQGVTNLDISVSNKGTGPAIIERVVVKMNGKELEQWHDIYEIIALPDTISISNIKASINGEVIMPGEKIVLISWNDNPQLATYIAEKLKGLEISICYRSIHNDYWTVSREDFQHFGKVARSQSKRCQLKATTYFQQ